LTTPQTPSSSLIEQDKDYSINYTVSDFDLMGIEKLEQLLLQIGTSIFNVKTEAKDKEGRFYYKQDFKPELLSKYLSMKFHIKTCSSSYYKLPHDMYSYNSTGGIYVNNTEKELKQFIKRMYPMDFTDIPLEKVYIDIRSTTETPRPSAIDCPDYIPMGRKTLHILQENGVYSVETVEHTHKRFIILGIPTNYEHLNAIGLPDPDQEKIGREAFETYLSQILPEEKDRITLQDYIGLCVIVPQLFNKALIILGQTGAGKTTLMNIIMNAFGKTNCSAISLYRMSKERFHTAELENKRINIADDLDSKDISNVSQFKILTGGSDKVSIERKFKDPTEMYPMAKHIFSANQLPAIGGADTAFFSRFIIIKFKQKFPNGDKTIDKKLNIPAVNTYIIRWAVAGLLRTLNNNGFTYPQTAKEIATIWSENNANPIVAFMSSPSVIYDPAGLYLYADLEKDIIEFARDRIIDELSSFNKPPNTSEIGRYINNQRGLTREKHTYKGFDKTFYRGIRPNYPTDYQNFDMGVTYGQTERMDSSTQQEEFESQFNPPPDII
jgi:P4 family phage/plasmid primase-like protien